MVKVSIKTKTEDITCNITEEQLKRYNRKFKKATLMDDMKFRKICESKGAIEEILRVVLKDNKLVVIESVMQKTEDMPVFHGVTLDCRCRLKTGELVNIEVQVALDDDPVKRMRYNEAIVTINNSPKSKRFKYKDIPTVILIMFCQFDIFKKDKAIYEIDRVVRGTRVISDNGVREVYVNITAKTTDKKLKSLFKIMSTVNEVDDETFPKLSKKKTEVNDLYIGGNENMAGLDLMMYRDGLKAGRAEGRAEGKAEGKAEGRAEGRAEGMQQGIVSILVRQFKDKKISAQDGADYLNVTVDEFLELIK